MDTLLAFSKAQGSTSAPMVFDWHKAAELIRARRPSTASAGLAEDWEWTGGGIYSDGAPVKQCDTYTYLSSNWATPELEMDGERMDCFIKKADSPGWDSDTYWPESALAILNA